MTISKVSKYALKMLSIVMNALGVVSGISSGSLGMTAPSMALLIVDVGDLKAMVLEDMRKVEEEEE